MQKTNVFKRVFLLFVLIAAVVHVRADNVEYLTFNVGGKPVVVSLAEHPIITFTDNALHIKTAKETIDVPVADISGAIFSETTDINSVIGTKMQMHAGCILFQQLPVASKVTVFAADGAEVLSVTADDIGQAIVNINELPKGVYIVNSAMQSIKFVNK